MATITIELRAIIVRPRMAVLLHDFALPPRTSTWRDSFLQSRRCAAKAQIAARQLIDARASHQPHVTLELGLQQPERALDAFLSGCCERIQVVAAYADRLGSERQ